MLLFLRGEMTLEESGRNRFPFIYPLLKLQSLGYRTLTLYILQTFHYHPYIPC